MPLDKKKYDERKRNNECVQCGDQSTKTRCTYCTSKNKLTRLQRRQERKLKGICTECPNIAAPNRLMCFNCGLTRCLISQTRYYENKQAGKCRLCGQDSNGKSRCPKHVNQLKDWRRNQKTKGRKPNGPELSK